MTPQLDDAILIRRIAVRAIVTPQAVRLNRLDVQRDIEAVHGRTPLRLAALLYAGDMDFFAEILGITRSRTVGTLAGYAPRFARRPFRKAA